MIGKLTFDIFTGLLPLSSTQGALAPINIRDKTKPILGIGFILT